MATSTKKKGSATVPGDQSPSITNAPEKEQTPKPQESEVLELEAEVVDNVTDQIGRELAKFGRADHAIAKLKEAYSGMTIDGVKDKEGYKKVRKAWSEVRGYRTGIEKKKKDIKSDYIKIGKAIDGEEERLLELITPLEDELGKTWRAIDDEIAAEEKRKEEEEQKRLNDRVTELMTIGLRMNSGYYQLGDTITIDVATLRTMTDEVYSTFRGKCENKAAEIKLEEEKLKQAKLDEENKLRKEREDLDRQKQELADQKAALEKMRKEGEELKKGIRVSRLADIGMIYDPKHESFTYWNGFNGVTNQAEEVFGFNDEQFANYLTETSLAIKTKINEWTTHKMEEEKKAEALKKFKVFIFETMTAAGLLLTTHDNYQFRNSEGVITIAESDLLLMTETAVKNLASKTALEIKDLKIAESEAKKEKETREEKERLENMSDVEIWKEEISDLRDACVVDPAKFKSKKNQTRAKNLTAELNAILDKYSD